MIFKICNCILFLTVVLGLMEKNYVRLLANGYNLFNVDFSHDIHVSV